MGQNGTWSRTTWGLVLLVFVATLMLFWPATGYDFVALDDNAYVVNNPDVTGGLTRGGVKAAFGRMQECLWIPLLNLSLMLDVECRGLDPRGFHSTNIWLHALNAALLFVLLRRWSGRRWFACWAALFWAWHPLRVESVAWISGRKDVLSGLFFLLCLLAYTRSTPGQRRSRGWFWASAGFLGLGLMSKSTLMATPFLLLVLDIWPLNQARLAWADLRTKLPRLVAEKWMFWLLGVLSGALAVWGHAARESLSTSDLWTRLSRVPVHLVYYLWKTAWPRGLNVLYDDLNLMEWRVVGSLLLVVGISGVAWALRRRWPAFAVGWLWYVALLLPVTGIVGFGVQSRADRYTYLPAMGLVLLVAQAVPAGSKGRRAWAAAGAAMVLAVGLFTARNLPIWRNSGSLFARVLEANPHHFQGNINQGIWLWEQGEEARAGESFRRAWAQPVPVLAGEALGTDACRLVLRGQARLVQAMLKPTLYGPEATALIHGCLGMACLHLGEWRDAVWHLNQSLAMDPKTPRFRIELVRAYFESGEEGKAREQAARLKEWLGGEIRTSADLLPFYLQLWRDGARSYAWVYFQRLAEREPENAALLNNLAWLVATDGKSPPEAAAFAVEYARQAVQLTGGDNAAMLDTSAAALANTGDFEAATATGEKALRLAERQGSAKLAEDIGWRLEAYRKGDPWRAGNGEKGLPAQIRVPSGSKNGENTVNKSR